MPEYLDDPSVLTKDKLKSELLAHNVELPNGNPNKDVYVQLYLKNLTVQNSKYDSNRTVDAFSSDEELPPVVVSSRSRSSGKKATRKTDNAQLEELDSTALSDSDLRDELLKHGVDVGPIVASTRKLYEKKLQNLLDESPAQLLPTDTQVNHNGNSDSDVYSDKEDEVTAEPEPEPEPEAVVVVERAVRSRGKTSVSSQQMVEKITASDQNVEEKVQKELIPDDIISPAGMTATCRRPIRGASGQPVTSSDLWSDKNCLLSPETTKTSSFLYTERHSVNRVSSQKSSRSTSSPPPPCSTSSSWLSDAAPPAGQTRAVRGSVFPWKRLALLGAVAAFVFLVYQAMEPNSTGSFGK